LSFDWIFEAPPFIPGQGQKPKLPRASHPVSEESFRTHEIFKIGLLCHQRGYHWECHEILESLWHLQTGALKDFIQVLIQRTAAELKERQQDRDAARRIRLSALTKIQELQKTNDQYLGVGLENLKLELKAKTQGEARST